MPLWSEVKAEQVLGVHGWGAKRVMISHLLFHAFNPGSLLEVAGTSNRQITSVPPVLVITLCIFHHCSGQPGLIQLLIYLAYTVLSSQNSDLARSFIVNNNKMRLLNEGLVPLH